MIAALLVVLGVSAPGRAFRVPSPEFRVEHSPSHTRNPEPGTRNPVHDTHVSHTRMIVDGRTVACRIRLFKDDLEKALRLFGGKPDLAITPQVRLDSLFQAYVAKTLTIEADGRRVGLRVTGSGTEKDPAAQEVVWYLLEGESPAPPRKLGLLHGVMFEMFRDQQNLVQLLKEPGDVRKTLYFESSDPTEQVVEF
ncbi:MAG TPA: DUF6702 family protein [Gemmatimonadales bacterium]|nr:DUF6702 family protein [Gemmatimonadales bacterium]